MESDVIYGARKKSAGGKGKIKTGDDRGRKILSHRRSIERGLCVPEREKPTPAQRRSRMENIRKAPTGAPEVR